MAPTKKSKNTSRMVLGTPAAVRAELEKLGDDMAMVDHTRLIKLLPLIQPAAEGPTADRAVCVKTLFAGNDATFRAFTARVNRKADGKLLMRSMKRADGQTVIGIFTPDDTEQRILDHAQASSDLPNILVDNPAVPGDPGGKLPQHFTVLRASADEKTAEPLIRALRIHLRSSKNFAHDLWDQGKVLTGQDPHIEVAMALQRSDYVIVLLSPNFFADQSLTAARAAARGRQCVPVALGLLEERHDLHEFTGLELYRGARGAWSQCAKGPQREDYVLGLFRIIEEVVERSLAGEDGWRRRWQDHAREATEEMKFDCVLDSHVTQTDLRNVIAEVHPAAEPQSGLQMLLDWSNRIDTPRYACVLGEFGIGKTTLLKRFSLELLRRRELDKARPLPIFLDLRTYVESIEGVRGQNLPAKLPRIEAFLGELMERTWKHPGPPPEPSQLLRLVREEGAIVIVDGLDEKLVHLSEAQGAELIRMLWGILPPVLFRNNVPGMGRRPGRIVISCRSHVFPSLQKQNITFTGGLRDEVRADDYLALVVLPFNEKKIREYLEHHLGPRVDSALQLIASVHNLKDLAPRPLFLNLIRKQIGRLEEMAARGVPVQGVSLYDHLVEACSDRDEGKHTIRPEDKPRFMEAIAAAMWRDGAREWPWDRVFHWLREYIVGDRVLERTYRLDDTRTARIGEDFRTATMVLRPDQGDLFRFAHTSLQEYFLARWLHRALVEDRPSDWMLPMPSDETLDFLGQLLIVRGGGKWQATLDGLLEQHRPMATRIAFRYWLLACRRGQPQPQPAVVCLPGEMLDGWTIAGTETAPLSLGNADLQKASLRNASLHRVDLRGADLRGADVACATLEDVDLRAGQIAATDFAGSMWRDCEVGGVVGEAASWWDSEWVRTVAPLGVLSADAARTTPAAEVRGGHSDWVKACAYSPDGRTIVSASHDCTLKIWDAQSGRALLTLFGHLDKVTACAYSPDGGSIVSASADRTLKVWDARRGLALLTLSGHAKWITACAYSPDGDTIVSASSDRTLKVWDARSGVILLTLSGHTNQVASCAFSPNGNTIISSSLDRTLKVWDARSGQELFNFYMSAIFERSILGIPCAYSPDGGAIISASADNKVMVRDARSGRVLLTLAGHLDRVLGCAYSPDGGTIISASADRTVKLWDSRSGRMLVTFAGHSDKVTACAFSPDGNSITSASDDRTLKVWDVRNGRELLTLARHSNWITACACSPDGSSIISASEDKTLRVWDAQTGRALTLSGEPNGVTACSFSPDGRTIVSASVDNTLKVWDARTGRVLRTLSGHTDLVRACAYSPDGGTIASASYDGTLRVWEPLSGQTLNKFYCYTYQNWMTACAYSPDGDTIVSGSADRTLRVWDARGGREVLSLVGHLSQVTACAYSPDGESIISASYDKTLRIWDARSGRALLTLSGHSSTVRACMYSPDGGSIVSASDDRTLKVWDAQSGQALLTLSGHSDCVTSCAYVGVGRTIVSTSADGTMRTWAAATGQLLRTHWQFQDSAATIDEVTQRVVWATPSAWRHLCYRGFDPERGAYRVYPIEAFGSLPH